MERNETSSLMVGWAGPDGALGRYMAEESEKTLNSYKEQEALVEEHANLERDTAQGGYQHRQLYELIQNSADALWPPDGAEVDGRSVRTPCLGRIEVRLTESCLYCADDGDPIGRDGVKALMFSHMSTKRGSDQIGTFGLGFKAVLGVCDSPEFYSRSGSFRFDRKRAHHRIREVVPSASLCPVLRLPEPVDPVECSEQDNALRDLMAWATNIVRLPLKSGAHDKLRKQMLEFPPEFILFVPHVSRLTITDGSEELDMTVELGKEGSDYLLARGGETIQWKLFQCSRQLTEDARSDRRPGDDRDKVPVSWAVPIDSLDHPGRFWAYFPTTTSCLVPGILNAPWKTNEDRWHLLPGAYNSELLEAAAAMIADALPELSTADNPSRHLDALPRRRETGDDDHAEHLRRSLFSILHDRKIVPDQEGDLKMREELRYPPQVLTRDVKESQAAFDLWASCPHRPVDWLHHSALTRGRLAKIDRLFHPEGEESRFEFEKAPRASLAKWLEALTTTVDLEDQESAARASMAALQNVALIPEEKRRYQGLGAILLTAAGDWQTPDSEKVFLPLDSSIGIDEDQSMSIVHPNLANDANTIAILKSLGLKQPSPESRFKKIMKQIDASKWSRTVDPDLFERFWKVSRTMVINEAVTIVKGYRRWQRLLHVRTCSGGWNDLHSVLMPGNIVPADGSRDGTMAVDIAFHEPDRLLLQELGVIDEPSNIYELNSDQVFDEYQYLQREEYRRHGDLPKMPRLNYLEFCDYGRVGPLDVLLDLSEAGKAVYTDSLLSMEDCYKPWIMSHKTRPEYPEVHFESLQIHLLREHGRVQTPEGIVPLADALGSQPKNLEALHTLLRHTNADKIKEAFKLSEPAPEFFGEGEPVSLIDIWPGLEEWLSPELIGTCLVPCERILVIGQNRDCIFQSPYVYLAVGIDDDERRTLDLVVDSLGLKLSGSNLEAILQRRTPAEVEARRSEIRQCVTDAGRLLAAVGEESLCADLPPSLMVVLEEEHGSLTGTDIAEAVIATYHTDSLRRFRRQLGLLDPPTQWAGSRRALEFVRSLGFSDAWAGEPKRKREPFMKVDGPRSLPELHDYQQRVASNLREMLRSEGAGSVGRRGMISMPTGSGKTRVAVQGTVEAMRDDGFRGGVLWVADRDELCEQAVEAWTEVWRSEGVEGRQLRISRLWERQERPLPTSDLHVVVASIQTLKSRLSERSSEYGFLREFKLVVCDEAHRSIAPSYTHVLSEIGLSYRTREDEPFLLGLTATPYRGHNEAETDRLASRYGTNRIDRGAFRSDDPQEVISELQDEGVLARATQEPIEGGTFQLLPEEWEEIRKFTQGHEQKENSLGWLPQTVEDRIAGSAKRTRQIIEAYEQHIKPDWPTLIFATSVEHAQTLAALLNRRGNAARAVSGATETATRRRIVEEFRNGDLKALVNYAVFREGFDAPKTRAIIVARPVYSPNLYFQMIGRGLRGPKNGGDERCLILNVRDNIEGFGEELAFSELDWLWDR